MLPLIKRSLLRTSLFCLRRFALSSNARGSTVNENNERDSDKYPNDDFDPHNYIAAFDEDYTRIRREEWRSLRVTILGLPNSGKSTLINRLINRPVCAASNKVNTTEMKSFAVYNLDNTQLVFLDTPGVVTKKEMKKYSLAPTYKNDVIWSIRYADVIGVLQDVSNIYTREKLTKNVTEALQHAKPNATLILILNKVDVLKKKQVLLKVTDALTKSEGAPQFAEVFMVSSLKGDGIEDLRNYFLDTAKPKDWEFDEEKYTDQSDEQLITRTVRAKLLDFLPDEIPYKLKMELEHFNHNPDGSIKIAVNVICPSDRIGKIVIGKRGSLIKMISQQCEQELCYIFKTPVQLYLSIPRREE